jgi:membrane protein
METDPATKDRDTMTHWKELPGMMKEAFADWKDDNAPRLGAALSYYTIFSLAPLLLIAVAIAGLAFGQEAAQGRIVDEIGGVLGKDGGEMIQTMVVNARKPSEGILATVVGLIALLFGASGAFNELRQAMNTIWEVPKREGGGIKAIIKDRILSFAMVLFIGFLLLVSLVLSAALSAMGEVMGGFMTEKLHILQIVNAIVSLGVITVLFAMIFKFLPDAEPIVAWKDVWIGAFMTAILFTIGKVGIGLYLGRGTVGSAYGAAGSLIVVLVWVYYAAQILFLGAELTQVYASRHGSRAGATAKARTAGGGVATARQHTREPFDPTHVKPVFERRPAQSAFIAAALLFLGRKKMGK